MHLPRCLERIDVNARLSGDDLLHGMAHLVVQGDELCRCLRMTRRLRGIGEEGEALHRLAIHLVHHFNRGLVVGPEVPVEILRFQNNSFHDRTLHRAAGSGQSKRG